MTKLLMTCGVAVLLAACASQPATTGSTAAPASGTNTAVATTTAPPATQGKLICEDEEQIGSHFHSRVCLTPEQVEARKKAAQDAIRNHADMAQCGANGCAGSPLGGPPRR